MTAEIKLVHNFETGQVQEVELTPEEIDARDTARAEATEKARVEAEALSTAKAALTTARLDAEQGKTDTEALSGVKSLEEALVMLSAMQKQIDWLTLVLKQTGLV